MNYTQAIENNKQFNLPRTWKNPKKIADGKHHRWLQSPDGKIGFLIRGTSNEFVVGYPTKATKASVYLTVECYSAETSKDFKLL